ncbi:MAG: CRISPR-associated endonuclease Cas2 [Aquirufa antheringensis]|nr:CRISPR-associated endonuclease Cas2 [Aquirufa antheringensis]
MYDNYDDRLNQYRSMWLFVYFDLPTETRKERKVAADFRKMLIKDGFTMFQYSIYLRFCPSMENTEVHAKRIRKNLPELGKICLMKFTDRQFGMMEIFFGKKAQANEKPPQQLEIF